MGLGNKMIEHQIKDEAQQLVKTFARTKGQPFDPSLPLINSVSNVICAFSFGHQFVHEDKTFLKLIEDIRTVVRISGGVFHLIYESIPWLMKYLPGPHQKALDSAKSILSFARQEIERHKQYQSLHEPQDFTDFYLLQMEKRKDDPNSACSEENLACCLLELFVAGVETTYVSLMWAVLLLANHPDIQEKVLKEIEDVFGSSGSISYEDRHKLPYTNAVIHETQRAKYVLFITIPRQSIRDVTMRDFHIPKGSIIMADLRSVLLDPEEWETPEEFNPNHFLNKDGKFQAPEAFMPFGAAISPAEVRSCFHFLSVSERQHRQDGGGKKPSCWKGLRCTACPTLLGEDIEGPDLPLASEAPEGGHLVSYCLRSNKRVVFMTLVLLPLWLFARNAGSGPATWIS
ncbi:cytochrome P450 2J2-like [Crotalus adamanteus]|uniref:Cytochrome P450 2J2-like n=1 Tax=Crotalus adamanteus TaxID=8729 RepID=A0AAW1BI16_CROAD